LGQWFPEIRIVSEEEQSEWRSESDDASAEKDSSRPGETPSPPRSRSETPDSPRDWRGAHISSSGNSEWLDQEDREDIGEPDDPPLRLHKVLYTDQEYQANLSQLKAELFK